MFGGSVDGEARGVLRRASCLRDLDVLATGEEATGRSVGRQKFLAGAGKTELPAFGSGFGSDFHEMVGGSHDGFVVLDDDNGVSLIGETAEDADQAIEVAWMETDRGFIENEKGIDKRRAEAGGKVDTHGFAAAQGTGSAVEGKVAESDLIEKLQAVADAEECGVFS